MTGLSDERLAETGVWFARPVRVPDLDLRMGRELLAAYDNLRDENERLRWERQAALELLSAPEKMGLHEAVEYRAREFDRVEAENKRLRAKVAAVTNIARCFPLGASEFSKGSHSTAVCILRALASGDEVQR